MSQLLHELDRRSSDRIDVALLWHERATAYSWRWRTGAPARFEIEVREDERALDVFHHPFAYAAWRGMEIRA